MEYCKQCGAAIDKKTGCCINCGLQAGGASRKKSNSVLVIVVIVFALAILLLVGKAILNKIASVTDLAPNDGYLTVTDEVIHTIYVEKDFKKFASYMPDAVIQTLIKDNYEGDAEAFYSKLEEGYNSSDEIVVDEGTVSWEVNEEMDLVAAMLDQYEEAYQLENGTLDKIRSAKALDVTISYTSNGETKKESAYLLLGLMEEKWYLIAFQ